MKQIIIPYEEYLKLQKCYNIEIKEKEQEIKRLNNIIKQKEQIIGIKDTNETIAWEEVVKLRKVIEEFQNSKGLIKSE